MPLAFFLIRFSKSLPTLRALPRGSSTFLGHHLRGNLCYSELEHFICQTIGSIRRHVSFSAHLCACWQSWNFICHVHKQLVSFSTTWQCVSCTLPRRTWLMLPKTLQMLIFQCDLQYVLSQSSKNLWQLYRRQYRSVVHGWPKVEVVAEMQHFWKLMAEHAIHTISKLNRLLFSVLKVVQPLGEIRRNIELVGAGTGRKDRTYRYRSSSGIFWFTGRRWANQLCCKHLFKCILGKGRHYAVAILDKLLLKSESSSSW